MSIESNPTMCQKPADLRWRRTRNLPRATSYHEGHEGREDHEGHQTTNHGPAETGRHLSRCDHQRYPSEAKPRRRGASVSSRLRGLVDLVFFVFFVAEYTCKRLPRFWGLCVSAFRYLEG